MLPATSVGTPHISSVSIFERLRNGIIRHKISFVLLVFLVLYASLQFHSLTTKSGTYDEPIHLTAGYLALAHQDYRIDATHPPLLRMWAAIPMLFMKDVHADVAKVHSWPQNTYLPDSYRYASAFVYNKKNGETGLLAGRMMIAILAALLGLLLFLCSIEWFGFWPATFVLGLFVIEPNLSGHAGLITTDMGASCFYFGSVYFLWRTFREYTAANIIGSSLFFALAITSKFSAVLLGPTFVILTLLAVFWRKTLTFPRALLLVTAIIATSYFAIWAVYGFRYAPTESSGYLWKLDGYFSTPQPKDWFSYFCNWIDDHRILPNAFIQGFAISIKHAQVVPSFFAGEINNTGWWYYFPVAFLMKTPTAMLLLLLWATTCCLKHWRRLGAFELVSMLTAAAIYFAAAVGSHINIGLRHILPIYPFLLVVLGSVIFEAKTSAHWSIFKKVCITVLVVWWSTTFINSYPNTLTFFNHIVGGTENGRKYLTDSNIDWGQHLKPLKRWMDESGLKKINLAYFGTADPSFYGIDRVTLPGHMSMTAKPEARPILPGYVAISETLMSGVYWSTEAKIFYAGFLNLKPVEIIGNTIRLYWVEKWPVTAPEEVASRKPLEAEDFISLADYLVRMKWTEQALIYYKIALSISPKSGPIYAKMGTIHLQENRRSEAIRAYMCAVEYSPNVSKYTGMLASLLIEQERYRDAKPYVQAWVEMEPSNPEALYCLASVHVGNHEYYSARAILRRAVQFAPHDVGMRAELKRLEDILTVR